MDNAVVAFYVTDLASNHQPKTPPPWCSHTQISKKLILGQL